MCAFQGFMHSSFWADPIFHTHILISMLNSMPIKTGLHKVFEGLVCMYVLYASVQYVCVLHLRNISLSVSSDMCCLFLFIYFTFSFTSSVLCFRNLKNRSLHSLGYMWQSSKPCVTSAHSGYGGPIDFNRIQFVTSLVIKSTLRNILIYLLALLVKIVSLFVLLWLL